MINNYLAIGQFEAARACIRQLIELDRDKASTLVYKLLELQPSTRRTSSIPSGAHLTWMLATEYHEMNENGQRIAREILQCSEFEMILNDLAQVKVLSATSANELSKLLQNPLTATLSFQLRQDLQSICLTYPIMAQTLCSTLSARGQQVGNIELARVFWTILVNQVFDHPHLLRFLTFTALDEPANASQVFAKLVASYFPPSNSYKEAIASHTKERIYAHLLALPPGQNYALQLYSNIEEAAIRRECEKFSGSLAWPFELIRNQTWEATRTESNFDFSKTQHQGFWTQYFDFITISKHHFIEFIITQFFELIHEHRFNDCSVLLKPFPKLKPLLLLMCFEKFGDDIKSKKEILDILWDESSAHIARSNCNNPQLCNAIDSIAYQVRLARWAGSTILQQISSDPSSQSLSIGSIKLPNVPENEPEIALSNLVSGMLKQQGLLYIMHKYLGSIELDDIEAIIQDSPAQNGAQNRSDLLLLYCYYVLREIIASVQSEYEKSEQANQSWEQLESIIARIDDPFVHLSLLEVIYNFIFMKTDAWNSSSIQALSSSSKRPLDSKFVIGQNLCKALSQLLSHSMALLRGRGIPEKLLLSVESFGTKLLELEWRLALIASHPYFSTPLLGLDLQTPQNNISILASSNGAVEPQSEASSTPVSIVSLLIAKPESLLIRAIRERDFPTAHAIVSFFKLTPSSEEDDELDVDGISTSASHLAKLSELVYSMRRDLLAGKPFTSSMEKLTGASATPVPKLEIFFLLCDMALTADLSADHTSKLLEQAQTLFSSEIQSQLSPEDAAHYMDYLERLKTLDKAGSLQASLPTLRVQDSTNSTVGSAAAAAGGSVGGASDQDSSNAWIPAGLNARLLALETWPTESEALGGYLQLRSRLQGAVAKLRDIVSQSAFSREKGFASPIGIDSEDTLKKLTLFLSVDDWTSAQSPSGTQMTTPAKSRPSASESVTPGVPAASQAFGYHTPAGASTIAPSPSTTAKVAFNSLGEGYLQAFLRQLLMLGTALREDPRVGKTDYFEYLQAAPKHLLAELVYGSRNYEKAETISNDLELDLISLILELMGTSKPSGNQRIMEMERNAAKPGRRISEHNAASSPAQADIALDYIPSSLNYNSSLSYEYGMSTDPSAGPMSDSYENGHYSLHLNLVEYLKAQSPLVATLACILRAPSDKFDERFLNYALHSTKRHFGPLHLWLRVKVRQFGIFYNTALRDQPEEVKFPVGHHFVQNGSQASATSDANVASHNSNPALLSSLLSSSHHSSQMGSVHHSSAIQTASQTHDPRRSAAFGLGGPSLGPSSSYAPQSASSFDTLSFGAKRGGPYMSMASSISSLGSALGGGGMASPTSSMNELGIDGGLSNNAMLAARAANAQRQTLQNPSSSLTNSHNSAFVQRDSSRFSEEEDEDDGTAEGEGDLDLSKIPSSYSPRTAHQHLSAANTSSSLHNQPSASALSASKTADTTSPIDEGLSLKFPSVDILDLSESHTFEQIFQSESREHEEAMYTRAVDQLEKSGHLLKALQLADASLPKGAPDSLLKKIIASTEDKSQVADYILRMSDKIEASQLALSLVPSWSIPTIMQVLFMSECHLTSSLALETAGGAKHSAIGAMLEKVRDMYERVQRYAEVLEVVQNDVQARWRSWLELDELARKDLAIVVQLLLNGGHYDIARRLTAHFKNNFLKLRVEEKYLLHLLETGDTRGVRLRLRSLEGEEAVRIAQSLMDLVTTNKDRLFLTQFIMERKSQQQKLMQEISASAGDSNSNDLSNLSATELGLKILLCLPSELQKVFQPLMSSPYVIIESLLVSEQTLVLNKLFKEVPHVHDDALVLKYARKALDATRLISAVDNVLASSGAGGMTSEMNSANSSRAVTPRAHSEDEAPPQTIGYAPDMQPESPYASMSRIAGAMIPGQSPLVMVPLQKKLYLADERKDHVYLSAPNYPLAAGIFDLCSNANQVAATCIEVSDQLSGKLHCIKDRLFVVRIIQQLLYYAKLRLMASETATLDLIQTCDMLLQRTELLLQLIFCGGTASASAVVELSKSLSLSILADPQKARSLRERLIENDMLDLALLVANKCGVEAEPVWAAKALRMLETNRYQEAKQLFRYCMVSAYPEEQTDDPTPSQPRSTGGLNMGPVKTVADNSTLLSKILTILEMNVPIEPEKLMQRRDQLTSIVKPSPQASAAQLKENAAYLKRFRNMEDLDSSETAIKNLAALRKPTASGATSASGASGSNAQHAASGAHLSGQGQPHGRRHTLDSIRYMQCIYYLQRFGSEEMFIKFWLRHDLLEDCLRHMDSKPPPYDTKLLLLVINHALSRNAFGRFKEALYKIDKDVERWREAMLAMCVHFHQAKMHTILLEIQVCMRDYTRAGLTCMNIYSSLSRPNDKMHYLDLVQRYFTTALETWEEYLAIQQKSSSSTARLPLTKVDIAKHIKTAGLQAKLIDFMETLMPSKSNPSPDSLPADATLWGNGAMKHSITQLLIVNHNFELAFKIIQEYRLSADKIYKEALVQMAKKKQTKKIEELLKSIKILLSGKDLDACHVAVARVYGTVHNDFSTSEAFATKVIDQPLACEAFIACRKLKQAYLIAAKLKDLDLVRAIQAEAKRLDMKREYELCDTFLRTNDPHYN